MRDKTLCANTSAQKVEESEATRKQFEGCNDTLPNNAINLYHSLYQSEVMYTDNLIGLVLQKISDLGMFENSIIIITADHGEGFDHNYYFTHGHALFSFTFQKLRVPLMRHIIPIKSYIRQYFH